MFLDESKEYGVYQLPDVEFGNRLELDTLLNQRHYAYTIFNGINTYTYDYTLCGRTVMLRATFKL